MTHLDEWNNPTSMEDFRSYSVRKTFLSICGIIPNQSHYIPLIIPLESHQNPHGTSILVGEIRLTILILPVLPGPKMFLLTFCGPDGPTPPCRGVTISLESYMQQAPKDQVPGESHGD